MERDQKKIELSTGRRNFNVLEINDSKNLTATLGAGKVLKIVCNLILHQNNVQFV